jgi:hypothetical protein
MKTTYPRSCTAALLAVVITYSNHFRNDFHFDDAHTILNNLFIRDRSQHTAVLHVLPRRSVRFPPIKATAR